MKRWNFAAAAILLSGAMISSAAFADVLPLSPATAPGDPGTFYVSGGAGFEVQKLPKWTATAGDANINSQTPPSLLSTSASTSGGAGMATLGFVLPNGLPIPGSHPRVEVSFGYGHASSTSSGALPTSAGSFVVPAIENIGGSTEGDDTFTPLIETGFSQSTTLTVDHQSFDGAVRLKSDFGVSGITLSPSIGLVAEGANDEYKFNYTAFNVENVNPPTGNFTYNSKEGVATQRYGVEAGTNATWQPTESWSFTGGLTGAVYGQHSTLTGSDCVNEVTLLCSTGEFVGFESSVSGSHDSADLRLGLNAGASYSFGFMNLSLLGVAAWDSAIPGINNPAINNTAAEAPATITTSGEWSYGGFLVATVPFD